MWASMNQLKQYKWMEETISQRAPSEDKDKEEDITLFTNRAPRKL